MWGRMASHLVFYRWEVHMIKLLIEARAAWSSGHRLRQRNRRSWARILQRVRFIGFLKHRNAVLCNLICCVIVCSVFNWNFFLFSGKTSTMMAWQCIFSVALDQLFNALFVIMVKIMITILAILANFSAKIQSMLWFISCINNPCLYVSEIWIFWFFV
jgi:hypothetical protein